jgi:hypothetical protein
MKLKKTCRLINNLLAFSLCITLLSGCSSEVVVLESYEQNGFYSGTFKRELLTNNIQITNNSYTLTREEVTDRSSNIYNLSGLLTLSVNGEELIKGYLYYDRVFGAGTMSFYTLYARSPRIQISCFDEWGYEDAKYGHALIKCKLERMIRTDQSISLDEKELRFRSDKKSPILRFEIR